MTDMHKYRTKHVQDNLEKKLFFSQTIQYKISFLVRLRKNAL